MPDPTAHADDMKSPAEYTPPTIKDALPPMWWFCPWPVVTALADKVDHLKSTSRGEQHARIEAEGLATLHKTERYDFLSKVEATLEAVGGWKGYNDTIELVVWAADEIKRLRDSNSLLTEANQAAKNVIKQKEDQLAAAREELEAIKSDDRLFANQYRIERDAARDALTVAKEHIATLDAKMHREQLDHAATLGYVRKVEAQLKRAKAKKKVNLRTADVETLAKAMAKAEKKGGRRG